MATEDQRVIGALEAGVKAAAETVQELRKLAVDQLQKTAMIESRMIAIEKDLAEMRQELDDARAKLYKIALIIGGGGMAAGGGMGKVFSIFSGQ
tara:strand:- start:2635 stop:2916 length:282 start_codon:yes stop_codon:yes gene_type:complete